MNADTIREALREVKYPGFSRDIVSFGLLQGVEFTAGRAVVSLTVTSADPEIPGRLRAAVEEALRGRPGLTEVEVRVAAQAPKRPTPGPGASAPNRIPGVRHVLAVASGKGGVGKSTFAVNLACALERALAERGQPNAVGLMDCDIYGPSVPLMLGVRDRPEVEDDQILPLSNFGVRVMSMGLLLDEDAPVVWRGPMVTNAIVQFTRQVRWAPLEILVVDLPPGTGDAQLTLAQTIALAGAVIVTTPQTAAVNVARRGAGLFAKVNVPILGVVENMSYFDDPAGGPRQFLFGSGGGAQTARDLQTRLLGSIPLDPTLRESCDRGVPHVLSHPEAPSSQAISAIARALLEELA